MKDIIEQAPWMFYVFLAFGVVALLSSFALFDYLVRWEFRHHRDAWEADGSPGGFFWRSSPLTTGELTPVTRSHIGFQWLFRTPPWIAESSICRRVLFFYRVLVGAWHLGFVSGVAFLYAFRH